MKYVLVLLSCFVISCNTPYRIRDIVAYDIIHKQGQVQFEYSNDRIMLPININDSSKLAMVDLGFSGQVLLVDSSTSNSKVYKKSSNLPEGKVTVYYSKFSPDINTSIFEIKNALGVQLIQKDNDSFACKKDAKLLMLGASSVLPHKAKLPYFTLSFSNNSISYDSVLRENIEGYYRIKFSSKLRCPMLQLTLNGQKEEFMFDTGNPGYIYLGKNSKNQTPTNDKQASMTIEGYYFGSINGFRYSTTKFYEGIQFEEFKGSKLTHVFQVGDGHIDNKLGLDFISKYDWIFDDKNEIVYVKPIDTFLTEDTFINVKQFFIVMKNNVPQFLYKSTNNDRIKLFTPIKRINDFILDANTSCETLKEINALKPEQLVRIEYAE